MKRSKHKNKSKPPKIIFCANGSVLIGGKFASNKTVSKYAKKNPNKQVTLSANARKLFGKATTKVKSVRAAQSSIRTSSPTKKPAKKLRSKTLWGAVKKQFANRPTQQTSIGYYTTTKNYHEEYSVGTTLAELEAFKESVGDRSFAVRIIFLTDTGKIIVRQTSYVGSMEFMMELAGRVFSKYKNTSTDEGNIVEVLDIRVDAFDAAAEGWGL